MIITLWYYQIDYNNTAAFSVTVSTVLLQIVQFAKMSNIFYIQNFQHHVENYVENYVEKMLKT